jgi:hypothetical protein
MRRRVKPGMFVGQACIVGYAVFWPLVQAGCILIRLYGLLRPVVFFSFFKRDDQIREKKGFDNIIKFFLYNISVNVTVSFLIMNGYIKKQLSDFYKYK